MISVIVPIYNTPQHYLQECVQSIVKQDFRDWELLLIDDGSEKGCAQDIDELAKMDARCKVIHTVNGGVSAARNAGLKVARGEYISFIDSDDWIDDDYLMNLVEGIQDCDLSILKYKRSDEKTEEVVTEQQILFRDGSYIINTLLGYTKDAKNWALNSVWGKLYRKSIIDEYKIEFDVELRRLEDEDFNLQYFLGRELVSLRFIEKNGYNLRIHSKSTVHRYNPNLGEDLLLPLVKMKKRLSQAECYEQFCDALAYRTLLNVFIYLNDGMLDNQKRTISTIRTFVGNKDIQGLLSKTNKKKLKPAQKYIVYNATRKNYIAIWMYCVLKRCIKLCGMRA